MATKSSSSPKPPSGSHAASAEGATSASASTPNVNPSTTSPPNPTLAAHKSRAPVLLQANGIAQPSVAQFDPWNSASTGHQRADNRLAGSTAWRVSRNHKLRAQYKAGLLGGKRVADNVGAGSAEFGGDGRKPNGGWARGAKGLRTRGQRSLWEAVGAEPATKPGDAAPQPAPISQEQQQEDDDAEHYPDPDDVRPGPQPPAKQIFANLTFYINGSTAPLVSDHRLKHLIASRGGRTSVALGRRAVTHVVLGSTHAAGGAGGGLAGSKIQKEVVRVGGKGVMFVGAEWVLECVRREKRVPEAGFARISTAPAGQRSVMGMWGVAKPGVAPQTMEKEREKEKG